jgi:hypothetical protein
VKYIILRAIQEIVVVDSYPVILVNRRAISQYGFLNELTWKIVISSGTTIGSSKNWGKRSSPLL